MLQFDIELKLAQEIERFQVEELDPWPDPEGYVRYRVSNAFRNSIVVLNRSSWERPWIMTEQDAWRYLEQLLYPEISPVYSEEAVFLPEELEIISGQIGKYIMRIKS